LDGINSNSRSNPLRKLHHIKEEVCKVAVTETSDDVMLDSPSNDTNEADFYYFACMTNHYLRLVNTPSPYPLSHHNMKYPVIVDSVAIFLSSRSVNFLK
jgi:hypothetical protein